MQTKFISAGILAIVLLLSSTLQADDMQKYLSETQKLIREGKHKAALERCHWFHDHALEHQPSMYGVRLSFALSYWKQLGEAYPPALVALQKIRDDKTALITGAKGTNELFTDVAAINRTLGDHARTVELFRQLDQKQDKLAARNWSSAKDAAFHTKAYDLIKKYLPNPAIEFATIKAMYDHNLAMVGKRNFGAEFKTYTENTFIEKTTQLMGVAIAIDNLAAAKDIQTQALATLDTPRLHEALPAK